MTERSEGAADAGGVAAKQPTERSEGAADAGGVVAQRPTERSEGAADKVGVVKLWETRGYAPGCSRVSDPKGDHLDCPGMRPYGRDLSRRLRSQLGAIKRAPVKNGCRVQTENSAT